MPTKTTKHVPLKTRKAMDTMRVRKADAQLVGMDFLSKAVSTAGRPLVALNHEISEGIKTVGDLASKVPIVGPGLHGIFTIVDGPFATTDAILRGERIDKAVLADLKSKVSAYKEIAPYAQTIVSLVPGVGQGVAGAIAASSALVSGMPIDKAVIAGVKGAIPGGPIAQAAFSVTVAAASGENVLQAGASSAVDVLHLPPQAKQALNLVYKAAKGDNIPKAALEEARNAMPSEDAKRAVDMAIAVANGKRLQDIAAQQAKQIGSEQMGKLASIGGGIISKTPVFAAGQSLLNQGSEASGYRLGVGLMAHTGVTPAHVMAITNKLSDGARKGFNMALSSHIAAVTAPPIDHTTAPKTQAGYFATYGMAGHPQPAVKAAIMKTIAVDPAARAGAQHAIVTIRKNKSLWHRVLEGLGFQP